MNTPIADMVAEMLKNCIPNEMIVLAVRTIELALVPTSTRHQVDDPLEKRRAWDREYRRKQRDSTRHPPDIHPTSDDIPSLLREDKKLSKIEVVKKESKKERGHKLPPDWVPTEAHYAEGERRGLGRVRIDDLAVTLRLWCATNDNRATTTRANWDSFFMSWIRREKTNGHGTDNHRPDFAAGRATAREANHVATMGTAALRYLKESKSAGAGRETPGSADFAGIDDAFERPKNAH